ncbi:MAG: MFS transporter [Candidatus Micrarchaeota archaeon]|nr:MFS transporter [Candidatus Micrarchaeota archaeon]
MAERHPDEKGYDLEERKREAALGANYKWIALSNTTLGVLMATIDSSILIISLPAIFNGLGVNPLTTGNTVLLLWLIMGYVIMSSIVVVTIGRLSDMFGRVRLYNIGFAIFAVGSTMLYVVSYTLTGTTAVLMLILFRLVQGFGGGFLFANATAILVDAFPQNQRGTAMGINQIAAIVGGVLGLIIGGILASIDWHLIFLISVPVGVIGALWSYLALREIATIKKDQKIDVLGNVTFAIALSAILLSMTYALVPYGTNGIGWSSPYVIAGLIAGFAMIAAFIFIELKSEDPMFDLRLFKIRAFAAGMLSLFLAGIARGGLQFMLIIWLQGIWLPLHGVSFEQTPLQAGLDMIPLFLGFLVMGPVAGHLSDRYGARLFSTLGMLINVIGFVLLAALPANFNYVTFGLIIFGLGMGQGMFAAPNTVSVMNSVPPEKRGSTSGMRATFFNMSFMFSIIIFFTLLTIGFGAALPDALYSGLVSQGVPASTASSISMISPTSTLFAALLGYNPMKVLLPENVTQHLPESNLTTLTGSHFFPSLISQPFIDGMHIVMAIAALLALVAAIASALRGKQN